ncbi:MAG TPA: hypothetical protein ENH94_06815 [Phycisphaerales bacterium]|nr:hypothetical protein [Phycisphaerales bacterium]
MPNSNKDSALEKAVAFFERAEEVAATENFDYAIDMYLRGLRLAPNAVEEGHIPLRKLALLRQVRGGKKPSVMNKFKRHGKEPLDEMLSAAALLARDPDHLPYAEAMLTSCVEGDYKRSAEWIAQLIFEANLHRKKPSLAAYILLKESYAAIELYEKAIAACDCACKLKPSDGALHDELRDLSARLAVQRGKYDQGGDFRNSIKDRKSQEILHSQDSLIKSEDYRKKAVETARKEVEKKPDAPACIITLADALYDLDTKESYQEALTVLQDAHEKSKDFTFKRHHGELTIKRLKRKIRSAKAALDAKPDNGELRQKLHKELDTFGELELNHYRLCVENYPTDGRMKYEYGVRLTVNKEFDKAIPLFQDAQKDPRLKIAAMDKTGLCFFFKGWLDDAVDIFTKAIGQCPVKDGTLGKELRYNLARTHEEKGEYDKALEIYRKLAQLDFNYKDVRKRVDNLRDDSKE